MPLGSLGRASRARRTYGGAGDILMTPELEASLVSRVGDRAVGGIAQFANVLDLPGSVVRDFFTGNNPVDQLAPWNWTSSNNRASGRDVLRTFGLEPTRQHGFAAAAADIGTSMVLDPLSYITLGGSALTRGGRVASAAGLMDDATRVAASKLGRPAGMVGRREARLATTLDDLLKANPLKRQAAETAASGMGLKLDDLLGDQLGGMVGIGLPFANPTWVAGTGARGMRAAKSMDAVQDAIQYARIPGTNFQPVNSFARLFNAKLGEAATPIGQAASETLFNRRTKGQYQARGVVAQMMTELEDLGMAEEQYSDVLRAAFELPGAIDNVPESLRPMVDRARSMLRYMPDEAADWGVRIKEYLDPEAAYFPRFVSEGLHPKHNKAGRVFSSFDPSQGERMTFMHGIRGGTVTSKDVWRDEVLNQLIDNKAGVDAVADQLRTLYAGRATDTYIHPQASKDLIREVISSLQGNQQLKAQLKAAIKNTTAERAIALAKQYLPYAKDAIEKIEKKHTKDRFKEMATWFSGLSKETRDTAVFGNSPLADLQARLLNYSDSIEAAKVFTETLAQPGLLQSAASEGGMTVDELIRKSGLQIGTPDKGPIAKLAEMMGISRAGLTDDQWKAELMKLRQSKVSSDIAEDMIRMQKGFSTPDSVNPIIEAVQNVTNFTKSNLTSPFPAFHVRNIFSGQFNNWMRGMFSKRSVSEADTMMRGGVIKDAKEIPIVQQIWAARNQASSTTSPSIGNPLFAMNTRGQGVQYHGARGPIGDFAEGFYSPDNIYGGHNTFYSTDAVDVAVGYGRKQPTAKVYQIEETGPVNFFDMEQAMEGDQLRAFFPDSDIVDDAIGSVLQDKGAPANLREVMDEIRAMSKEYGISKDEVQEIFDGVTYNLGQKGFGGMSHVGGLKTGADKHTVKIYFDPKNQIRLKDTGFNPAGGDELVNLSSPKPVQSGDESARQFTPRFKPESPATKLGDTTAIGKIGNKEINKWSQHEMQTIASHDGFSRISQDHARFSTMIEGLRKQGALRDEDASILRLVFAQSDVVSAMPTDMHAGKVAIDALGNPDYQAAGLASLLRQGGKFKTRVSFVDDELRNRGTNLMLHELAHIAWYRGVHQGDALAAKAIEEFDEILKSKGDKAFFDFFAATKGPDRASYYTSKPAEVFAEYFAHSVIRRRIPQGAIGQYMTAALDWLRDMLVKMRLSKALDSKTRARLDELIDQVGGFSDAQAMQSRAAAMTMPPSSGAGAGVPNVPGMPGATPSVPPGAGPAVPPTAPPAMPPQGPPLPPNMPGSTPQAPKPPRELDDIEATRILSELAYAHQVIGKYQGEAGNVLGQSTQVAGSTIQDMLSLAPSPARDGFQMTDAFKTYFGMTPETTWNPMATRGVGGQVESRFAPLAGGEKFGWYSEGLNRLSPFLKMLREGIDPAEAAKRIGDSQVNYANRFYTRFERDRVSLLLPFYKFSRGMMPATLRELAEKPGGKLAQTMRAINSARDTDALTPDYVAETASIPLNGLPVVGDAPAGTQRYLTGLGLMFEDPLSFFGGGVRGAGLEFLSRTNPLLKAPLEWATGESFFQRGPRGGRELEDLDPTIGRALSNIGQLAADPGSILSGGNPAKVDPVRWPGSDAMEFVLGNSPAARLLSSARAATDPRKSLATKALNLLTGVRISDVSPEASEAILRERTRDVMQMLGSRTFERTYFPQERMDGLPPELQLEVLQLQALMNTLAARAKARAEAAANR